MIETVLTIVLPWASVTGKELDGNGCKKAQKVVSLPSLPGPGGLISLEAHLPDSLVEVAPLKVIESLMHVHPAGAGINEFDSYVIAAGLIFPRNCSIYSVDDERLVREALQADGWSYDLADGYHPDGYSHREHLLELRGQGWVSGQFDPSPGR